MANRKKKPQKTSMEGVLLLALVICVFLFVCGILLFRHPAGSILFPLQAGTVLSDPR